MTTNAKMLVTLAANVGGIIVGSIVATILIALFLVLWFNLPT